MQPELVEQEDAALGEMVMAELRELLGVRGHPEFLEVVRYHRAMPQYHVGHLERVARIEHRLESWLLGLVDVLEVRASQ